jgi:hypothetical protein
MNAVAKWEVSLRPQNFQELLTFADRAAKSSMVPKDYQGRPENVLLAVQMGSELGLAPMQSLQNIAVINGRPGVFGDAMPGLCRQSPLCEDIEERVEGEGDQMVAICIAKRAGKKPVEARFSVADAKKAGLWGKSGPWTQYPQRMLVWRARSWALRDAFPDVLRGLGQVEELRDMEPPHPGPTIDHAPEPEASVPSPPPPDRRDAINNEVPVRAAAAATPRAPTVTEKEPKRRTLRDILEATRIALRDAQDEHQVDAILCSEDFVRAKEAATGTAKTEFEKLTTDTLTRWWPQPPDAAATPVDDDPFAPGLEIAGGDKLAAG